jgi:hypothetical protein
VSPSRSSATHGIVTFVGSVALLGGGTTHACSSPSNLLMVQAQHRPPSSRMRHPLRWRTQLGFAISSSRYDDFRLAPPRHLWPWRPRLWLPWHSWAIIYMKCTPVSTLATIFTLETGVHLDPLALQLLSTPTTDYTVGDGLIMHKGRIWLGYNTWA